MVKAKFESISYQVAVERLGQALRKSELSGRRGNLHEFSDALFILFDGVGEREAYDDLQEVMTRPEKAKL